MDRRKRNGYFFDTYYFILDALVMIQLRVEAQLQETMPYINLIRASFLEMPQLDFTIKPMKGIDIMDIPGLSTWLRAMLTSTLSEIMVEPNQLSIPLDQMMNDKLYPVLSNEYRKLLSINPRFTKWLIYISYYYLGRAVGILHITVLEAKGLPTKDITGTNDPYCKLSLKHDMVVFKTSIKKHTRHPSWEESFPILIYNAEQDIVHIRVFDYNTIMPDELIGECDILIAELTDSVESSYEK
jgi:Ca2+-dependent lipid-binding protein